MSHKDEQQQKNPGNPYGHFLKHSLHVPTTDLGSKPDAKWHVQFQLSDVKEFYANTKISNMINFYLLV